jgi:hypothetical protein
MGGQRVKRVEARLTEDELLDLHERAEAAGLSLSDLIRQSVRRTRTWTAADRKAYRERTFQLARIGNNLNQIARAVNTYKSRAEAMQIVARLAAIQASIKELLNNDDRI